MSGMCLFSSIFQYMYVINSESLYAEIVIEYMIHVLSRYTASVGEYHVNSMHSALRIGSSTQSGHTDHMNASPHFNSQSQSRVWVMFILDQSVLFIHSPYSLLLLCTPLKS